MVEGSLADSSGDGTTYGPGAVNSVVVGSDSASLFRFTIPTPAGVVAGTPINALAVGSTSEFSNTVIVTANLPPVLDPVPNQVVDEGSLLTFTATGSDPNPGAILTFDLVSGPAGAAITPGGVFTWTPPEGPLFTSVTISISDGSEIDTETINIFVRNVTPEPTGVTALPSAVFENGVVTLSGTIDDPSLEDTFSLIVDWGDGSEPETFSYPALTSSFNETHTYLDDGDGGPGSAVRNITLTLRDDDNIPRSVFFASSRDTDSLYRVEPIAVGWGAAVLAAPFAGTAAPTDSGLSFLGEDLYGSNITPDGVSSLRAGSVNTATGVFTELLDQFSLERLVWPRFGRDSRLALHD